uniref:Gelsolin repeat protein n=1 Tax=Haemonchus contortus TaxID=6289 RepID=A0A7I4Z068_HAECO
MAQDIDVSSVGKEPGLEVWRIKEFTLEAVPKNQYGLFYSDDTYIVLNSTDSGWDVHFWIGKTASQDERGTAAIKTVEIDQALNGLPVQHREVQNHESPLFISYFPNGIRYLAGGYKTGFHHVEEENFEDWQPRLFHCKGKRNVRCYQVPLEKESLNLGDVFLLDLGKDIYVWMPLESGRLERIKGMALAKEIAESERHGHAEVHILDTDWNTDVDFWSHFGGVEAVDSISSARNDDENYWQQANKDLTLYKVSDATGDMRVTDITDGQIRRSQLESTDAFILDAGQAGIFVWIGKECTLEERAKAWTIGENFVKEHGLPEWTTVTRVLETAEPTSFTQWFDEWVDSKSHKAFQPRLYQVSDKSGGIVVEEIANFTQENLDGDDVMILDALNRIYVWVGENASQSEKQNAVYTAEKYLKMGHIPRHEKTTIETIYQGKETPDFKKLFPKWSEAMFRIGERSVENMRKLLFE